MLVALTLWLMMGVVAGMIATSKDRSGIGFGLLGFILGPFGILAAALASRGTIEARGLVACSACAEPIQPAATLCRYCGTHRTPEERQLDFRPLVLAGVALIVFAIIAAFFFMGGSA